MQVYFLALLSWRAFACMTLLAGAGLLLAQPTEKQTAPITATLLPANASNVSNAADDLRPELQDLLPQNQLMGKGRLNYWGFPVYDARLWAAPGLQPEKLATQPFALELAYLRDFSSLAIAERSIVEMRRSASISEAQAKTWVAQMLRVIPDVRKGDRVMGVNRPGLGALFLVNGKPSGEIRDPEFARLFFGIWLSVQTSEPKLRSALLAGAL